MEGIAHIITAKKPDVIALQEMTATHWESCLKHKSFQMYHWSDPPAEGRYYTLLGSLRPFPHAPMRSEFEVTMMGRDFLAARIKINGCNMPPLVVGTSHLESLNSFKVRREQMNQSFHRMDMVGETSSKSEVDDMVFCGDTNINEQIDGMVSLPHPWKDAWLELRGRSGDPGFTFDVDRNGMMAQMDGWAQENRARLRFDRFWTKLKHYRLDEIELVGVEALGGSADVETIWASDHFGLLLTLEALEAPQQPLTCDIE